MTIFMLFSLSDSRDLLISGEIFRQPVAQRPMNRVVHMNKNLRRDDRQSTLCWFLPIEKESQVLMPLFLTTMTLYSHYLFKVSGHPADRPSPMKAVDLCC
ncbi:hypothetical protein [Pseudomonas sp. NPDC090201]|uniref:hypothetical protein n=1 Tax=Pseudomonas sp. NPDC090201 TaxID=3364475 RepID=UPI00381F8AD6